MTTALVSQKEIRKEVHELRDWFRLQNAEGQRKWMRLGKLLVKIRDEGYWKEWEGPDNRSYTLFDDYMEKEVGVSKSKCYALINVVENLKLPVSKMEELGKSACYELARVGKEKPKALQRILDRIEKESEKGPVSLQRIRTMVNVVLEGSHLPSGKYINLDFLLAEDRASVVMKALKVIQAEEPVEEPSSPAARGIHLLSICEEYLSGEAQKKTLKKLEKAGAFDNTPFKLEE